MDKIGGSNSDDNIHQQISPKVLGLFLNYTFPRDAGKPEGDFQTRHFNFCLLQWGE